MRDPVHHELRQIKWILAGIAACLVVIVLAVAPVLVPLIFAAAVGLLIVGVIFTLSQTARGRISDMWHDLARRWPW